MIRKLLCWFGWHGDPEEYKDTRPVWVRYHWYQFSGSFLDPVYKYYRCPHCKRRL